MGQETDPYLSEVELPFTADDLKVNSPLQKKIYLKKAIHLASITEPNLDSERDHLFRVGRRAGQSFHTGK